VLIALPMFRRDVHLTLRSAVREFRGGWAGKPLPPWSLPGGTQASRGPAYGLPLRRWAGCRPELASRRKRVELIAAVGYRKKGDPRRAACPSRAFG